MTDQPTMKHYFVYYGFALFMLVVFFPIGIVLLYLGLKGKR